MALTRDQKDSLLKDCALHLSKGTCDYPEYCKDCAVLTLLDDLEHIELLVRYANDYLRGFGSSVQRAADISINRKTEGL